jgi:hypothetical protein
MYPGARGNFGSFLQGPEIFWTDFAAGWVWAEQQLLMLQAFQTSRHNAMVRERECRRLLLDERTHDSGLVTEGHMTDGHMTYDSWLGVTDLRL